MNGLLVIHLPMWVGGTIWRAFAWGARLWTVNADKKRVANGSELSRP